MTIDVNGYDTRRRDVVQGELTAEEILRKVSAVEAGARLWTTKRPLGSKCSFDETTWNIIRSR
jgi:hypothetical protein